MFNVEYVEYENDSNEIEIMCKESDAIGMNTIFKVSVHCCVPDMDYYCDEYVHVCIRCAHPSPCAPIDDSILVYRLQYRLS